MPLIICITGGTELPGVPSPLDATDVAATPSVNGAVAQQGADASEAEGTAEAEAERSGGESGRSLWDVIRYGQGGQQDRK